MLDFRVFQNHYIFDQVYEPFLDLSLPLVEEKPQRSKKPAATTVKVSENEETAVDASNAEKSSKGKSKKKMNKKERRKARRENR